MPWHIPLTRAAIRSRSFSPYDAGQCRLASASPLASLPSGALNAFGRLPDPVQALVEDVIGDGIGDADVPFAAVAEGAMSKDDATDFESAARRKASAKTKAERQRAKTELTVLAARHSGNTLRLSKHLEELTHLEARVTILGYVQRGGTPSAGDRLLASEMRRMVEKQI